MSSSAETVAPTTNAVHAENPVESVSGISIDIDSGKAGNQQSGVWSATGISSTSVASENKELPSSVRSVTGISPVSSSNTTADSKSSVSVLMHSSHEASSHASSDLLNARISDNSIHRELIGSPIPESSGTSLVTMSSPNENDLFPDSPTEAVSGFSSDIVSGNATGQQSGIITSSDADISKSVITDRMSSLSENSRDVLSAELNAFPLSDDDLDEPAGAAFDLNLPANPMIIPRGALNAVLDSAMENVPVRPLSVMEAIAEDSAEDKARSSDIGFNFADRVDVNLGEDVIRRSSGVFEDPPSLEVSDIVSDASDRALVLSTSTISSLAFQFNRVLRLDDDVSIGELGGLGTINSFTDSDTRSDPVHAPIDDAADEEESVADEPASSKTVN